MDAPIISSVLDNLSSRKHSFTFQGNEFIILKRKHIKDKPPFYLFNLTEKCYVSSLKPTDNNSVFKFDIRNKTTTDLDFYTLSVKDDFTIEIKGA